MVAQYLTGIEAQPEQSFDMLWLQQAEPETYRVIMDSLLLGEEIPAIIIERLQQLGISPEGVGL